MGTFWELDLPSALHNCNLCRCQFVKLVHQRVYLSVCNFNLALQQLLLRLGLGCDFVLMQRQHGLDELHHRVVTRFVGGVGEVYAADGKFSQIRRTKLVVSA